MLLCASAWVLVWAAITPVMLTPMRTLVTLIHTLTPMPIATVIRTTVAWESTAAIGADTAAGAAATTVVVDTGMVVADTVDTAAIAVAQSVVVAAVHSAAAVVVAAEAVAASS